MNTNKTELTVNEMKQLTSGGQLAESLKDVIKNQYLTKKLQN